jgi:signal recognition particle subunit SRP54
MIWSEKSFPLFGIMLEGATMFDTLSERLSGIFDALTRRGALAQSDVDAALREVRRALIEADVALPVARSFVDEVREKAVGSAVLRSVTPGQMVVKIVHDHLVEVLGSDDAPLNVRVAPPAVIMMVGLQGSGKTTTTAKIARRLTQRDRLKVLMASLDVRRPAAQEQLRVLGEQTGVATLPVVAGQMPVAIARRALEAARLGGYDVVILDTAGRLHVDQALMAEMADIHAATSPHEVLLVADALTGQDAVNVATAYGERLPLTGVVLTRIDGDARGGAALSMRAVTGKPIKLVGTGEKIDELEAFHPSRIAGRILGMGDVVSLVEKAAETVDAERAAKVARKMAKGSFDLQDLSEQLAQMKKLGGMSGMMGLLPGIGKVKRQLAEANLDDTVIKRQIAIIQSMTGKERRQPKVLNASRKKRVAAGSGTSVQDINRLVKMHRQMADMMKQLGRRGMLGGLMGGGAPQIDPAEAGKAMQAASRLPQMPTGFGRVLPGLPGSGRPSGGLAGLPGLPARKK